MEIKHGSTIEKKSTSPYVLSQISQQLGGYGGYLSPHQAYWLWQVSDAVGSACDLISWAFEQLDPILLEEKTGEYIKNHPLLELINNPGFKMTADRVQYEAMTSFLVTNEVYPILEGNVNYEPSGLYIVGANHTTLIAAGDGWLGQINTTADYDTDEYMRYEDRKRGIWVYQNPVKLKETVQITNKTRRSGLRGQSVIERVYYQTLTKYYGNIHNTGIMKNGSRPGGIWSPDKPVSQQGYEAFKTEIDSKMTGPASAGRNIIAPYPVKYDNLILNPRDMDFLNLIENNRAEIYTQYGIPLPLVTADTMTMNNYQNAVFAFYDIAVMPRAKFLYKQLGKFALPRYKNSKGLTLTINEKEISALKERLYERVKSMRSGQVFSENEMRTEAGYESIGEEGDQIWKQTSWAPSGEMDDYTLDNIERNAERNEE